MLLELVARVLRTRRRLGRRRRGAGRRAPRRGGPRPLATSRSTSASAPRRASCGSSYHRSPSRSGRSRATSPSVRSDAPLQHPQPQRRGLHAGARQHGAHVHLRADRLCARPHRQLPHLRLPRRAAPHAPPSARLRRAGGDELHRRRRSDDRRRAERRQGLDVRTPISSSRCSARMRGRSASSRWRRSPRATDPENIKAMADLVNALDRRGHTYRSNGSVYFKICDAARLRQAGAARSRRHARRRARRLGQLQQGRRARLRPVEGDQAG